jgi:hypothetical protein
MTCLSIFSLLHQLCCFALLVLLLSSFTLAQSTRRTEQEAAQLAQAFLAKEQASPPNLAPNAKRSPIPQHNVTAVTLGKGQSIKDNQGSVVAYLQPLEPQGFIIISAYENVRPILAFSFAGKLSADNATNNPLFDLVLADIQARKAVLISHEGPSLHLGPATQWGPWLQTTWTQGDYWNSQCPYVTRNTTGARRVVGCVATAMAQIVNYWGYPRSLQFSDDEYIYISGTRYPLNEAAGWGVPSVAQLRTKMSSLLYNQNPEEEGYLSFAAGVKLHMDYTDRVSLAYTSDVGNVLNTQFRYGSAATYSGGSGLWFTHSSQVIDDIKNERPIQIQVQKSGEFVGHSIVVDGYRDDGYFHLNYGWGANSPATISNAWYNIPSDMPLYDVVQTVVYRIAKYQGWSQYGADERKTFRTPYGAPEKPVIREKWHVTCASDYSFEGLIVGDGETIVASCSPNNQNQGDPSSVWFIDQYGTKLGDIVLQNEDENLTVPVQSPEGDIYVGTGKGGIYKIDARARTAMRVFQEGSNQQFFNPPTVDQDGNIYFSTFHTLYCLSSSGSERWHFAAPNGGVIGRGCAAVDPTRGFVFIAHYNPTTKTPYLRCINRTNGTKVAEKTFPTVNSTSRSAGIASLDSDGTIYVGSNTTLYALNPDATLSEKWSRPFSSGMSDNAPVIGRNGHLYVGHWVGSSGNWTLQLAALDARNGNTLWSVSYPNLGDYDNLLQPYVAANDVILFTFLLHHGSGPSTYELHAYKDNSTSAALLWKKSFNSDGGNLSLGPGSTVYAIPSSGYGHKITAISDGDEGDPEGAGEGYENNRPPGLPSDPSPSDTSRDIDAVNVRLSWSCFDPDGHALRYSLFACAPVAGEEATFVPVATDITENSYMLTGLQHGTQYFWLVGATDGQAITEGPVWRFTTADTTTSVYRDKAVAAIPDRFELHQNFPNPFNPSTTIEFGLPQAGCVSLRVYNVLGEQVATLVTQELLPGWYKAEWNANFVSSGVYFYRLSAGSFVQTKKMLLLR